MPQLNPNVPPPFDQGVFLLHYNRGKEAFQEGRYAEARRELEAAQRLRPDDSDVLNLLGLIYFKTNAFPEAEVIYRRLVEGNPNVFILHSNLGLILFKQGNLDDAEKYLRRAVELRPNYAKSHLYLGLLYKQKKKFGLALEHLQFAGADKAVREVQAEMQQAGRPAAPVPPPSPTPAPKLDTAKIPAVHTLPGADPVPPVQPMTTTTQKVAVPQESRIPPPRPIAPVTQPAVAHATAVSSQQHAARKLQDAVDETVSDDRRLDLGRKIEGASKIFALHENGFLEINFPRSVRVRRGTISSYSGNLKFVNEDALAGTSAAPLVKAEGAGKLFIYDKGRKTFLLDLNDEFIYVEGRNLLAMEETLAYRVEPIYDTTYQQKIDTVKIFGRGSLAISTSIEPLTLRVTPQYPLSISSNALVAWTGNLIPTVIEDKNLENIMIEAEEKSFKIRFEGDGVVVSEQ